MSFVPNAGPRPVFVDVGEPDIRICLETVEDSVAVMRVDVDVRNALDAELAPRDLDCDAAIVENAKPGSGVAPRVMQAADRNERARVRSPDDALERLERAADDGASCLVDAGERRCVAVIEPPVA